MKFLFWNTNRNTDIDQSICDIVWENGINMIALAEYAGNVRHLINRLAANNIFMSQYITIGCKRVVILGEMSDVQPGAQGDRFSIQILKNKYLLCAMHLPSQIFSGHQERRNVAIRNIIEELERAEKKLGIKRSILVGDINEDPYDVGCLSAERFHGVPCKEDAAREIRTIEGKSFAMFYNPMWNFFGDFTFPPGTYYYSGSDVISSFWHIFDQVMIRPCLKDAFVDESLTIVTRAGIDSLLDEKGHPDRSFSDHLPIIFEIREEI